MAAQVELVRITANTGTGSSSPFYLNLAHVAYCYVQETGNQEGDTRLRIMFVSGQEITVADEDRERVQKKLDAWSHEPDNTSQSFNYR